MRKLVFLIIILISFCANSQSVRRIPLRNYISHTLPTELNETSGLKFFNEKLFTINDSGNTSEIYQIDNNTGAIAKIHFTKRVNKDWEAIASDSIHFYIGDFGNNNGSRKDLKILKIPFRNDSIVHDSITEIKFEYPEQKDFLPRNLNTDYDAEALLHLNNRLHIFTKEWKSKKVSHYTLPTFPSFDILFAHLVESFHTNFVVTDAAYFDKKLYLVGYKKNLKVFLHIFEEREPGVFFKGKNQKFKLGNALSVGQVEGISVNTSGVYISSERFKTPISNVPARLYFIPSTVINSYLQW